MFRLHAGRFGDRPRRAGPFGPFDLHIRRSGPGIGRSRPSDLRKILLCVVIYMLLTILVSMNIRGEALIRFTSPTSLTRYYSPTSANIARNGGIQIRLSIVRANATACSCGIRPMTRWLRPLCDHQARDRSSWRPERSGASVAWSARMQTRTGAPDGST